ncbi:MAG: KilA-N domain-containing protein [Deltaproteobacteria bacterium]|nr:KilA-N domain-containing protein [Deltaproteobacteria bacterium]
MNELTVVGISIRQDEQGRYSLVDLYKASGGNNRHRPSLWLHNRQAKALIEELNKGENKAGIPAYSTTQKSGAFVVKELVYAYAMWVSPAFNLKVIRAYDALINGEFIQPSIQHENYWFARRPHWPPIRMRVLAGECYRSIAEALQISRGRVARAVRSMIRVGVLAPMNVAQMQKGPARKAALKYSEGWGQRQMGLFDGLPV